MSINAILLPDTSKPTKDELVAIRDTENEITLLSLESNIDKDNRSLSEMMDAYSIIMATEPNKRNHHPAVDFAMCDISDEEYMKRYKKIREMKDAEIKKSRPNLIIRIWRAIKTAFYRLVTAIKDFFRKIFDGTGRLRRNINTLKQQVRSNSADIDKLEKVDYPMSAVNLYNYKGEFYDLSETAKLLKALIEFIRDDTVRINNELSKVALDHIKALKNGDVGLFENTWGVLKKIVSDTEGNQKVIFRNMHSDSSDLTIGGYMVASTANRFLFGTQTYGIKFMRVSKTKGGVDRTVKKTHVLKSSLSEVQPTKSNDLLSALDAVEKVLDIIDSSDKLIKKIIEDREVYTEQIDNIDLDGLGTNLRKKAVDGTLKLVQWDIESNLKSSFRVAMSISLAIADATKAHLKQA